MAIDVYIDLRYNRKTDEISIVGTDIIPERIDEVLGEYLRDQMGRGEDHRKPADKEEYSIRICLDMNEDRFSTESDTGNTGLTTGLVMALLERRGKNPQYGLESAAEA